MFAKTLCNISSSYTLVKIVLDDKDNLRQKQYGSRDEY